MFPGYLCGKRGSQVMEAAEVKEQKFYILEVERKDNQDKEKITGWHFKEVVGEIVDIGFLCECFVSTGRRRGILERRTLDNLSSGNWVQYVVSLEVEGIGYPGCP